MFDSEIAWAKKEIAILEAEEPQVEASVLAWAHNFLAGITPVIKQAATDAVLAAAEAPGSGEEKAAFALGVGLKDLAIKGVPVVESDLKAAIQIAYNALPASVTGNTAAQAVVAAADGEVAALAAKVTGTDTATTAAQ